MRTCVLFVFSWDLRLHDAPALLAAAEHADRMIFAVEPISSSQGHFSYESHAGSVSAHRQRFVAQSHDSLERSLNALGHTLIRLPDQTMQTLQALIQRYQVRHVYRHAHPGVYETLRWQQLEQHLPEVSFHVHEGRTLYRRAELPFSLTSLPPSFSAFRRKIEKQAVSPPLSAPQSLPPPPPGMAPAAWSFSGAGTDQLPIAAFPGGEHAALQHLQEYFESDAPQSYKLTRNALDHWSSSTKLSPWLAAGCLSPRETIRALRAHEARFGANESTYWIYFELLWREYFQWLATAWGRQLFRFGGNKPGPPLTSFYPQRFAAWCQGQTPWPIVNACMNQLRATGFMSNRGRQLVASCFVHELALDWRYGAAYFERQLIDYDMASNWGNWQYLAGVGVDPRGHRKFDLEKQTALHDPDGAFVARWCGETDLKSIDTVDCADWPVI